jgi:radical SAM superfamily enzyme YgiQ (UPF0313 family)
MNPPEVVLVFPRVGSEGVLLNIPHSLLYVASPLYHEGYRVKIVDQRLDGWVRELQRALRDPICIGITSMSGPQIGHALEVSRFIRRERRDVPIVWGGVHPTLRAEETLRSPWVDVVVRGEGEESFREVVTALESERSLEGVRGVSYRNRDGGIRSNPEREPIDLDQLLEVPYALLPNHRYDGVGVLTSKGCPHRCAFCYNQTFNDGRWRSQTPERSLETMRDALDFFGTDSLYLYDDNFFVNRKRVEEICALIQKEGLDFRWSGSMRADYAARYEPEFLAQLKKSGFRETFVGAESGSDRVLRLIQKDITVEDIKECNRRLRDAGIRVSYSFMCGFPTETLQEVYQTVDLLWTLLEENPLASTGGVGMKIYSPFPGEPLLDQAVQEGFEMPTTLEGWSRLNWYQGSVDALGWLSEEEKEILGNINFISSFLRLNLSLGLPKRIAYEWVARDLRRRWREHRFEKSLRVDLLRSFLDRAGWMTR